MAFHEVRFPASISFGSSGGIERRTEIVRLVNGYEERNTPWSGSRRRYDAGLGVRSLGDLDELLSFFEARRGMLHGFRWKDWLDHKSCAPGKTPSAGDQVIGKGDGQTREFQLAKTYELGPHAFKRAIRKPVDGSVRIAIAGVETATGFTLDVTTGLVRFDAPVASSAPVSAGFEFDVPVRFDTDVIEVNMAAFEAGEIPSIPVVEVRV